MHSNKSRLEELLSKEMTRQQFLATLGLALFSIFGFSGIIGIITKEKPNPHLINSGNGFGSGGFGS